MRAAIPDKTPKRASPRAQALWTADIWGADQTDAVCLNVSLGGMALAVGAPIPVDTLVRVTAFVPGLGPVHATAVVVWARRYRGEGRIGLRFVRLSPEALAALQDHVSASLAA